MKKQIMSAKEFRSNIFKALDDIEENLTPYIITKNGEPRAIVMSIEEVESMIETYDVIGNKDLMAQIKSYLKNRDAVVDWDEAKKKI